MSTQPRRWDDIRLSYLSNGRTGAAEVIVWDGEEAVATSRGQLMDRDGFAEVVAHLAEQLGDERQRIEPVLRQRWLASLGERERQQAQAAAGHPDAAGEKGPGASTRLVRLVQDAGVQLIHTPDQVPYAVLPIDGHRECRRLRSRDFRDWCQRQFYLAEGRGIGSQAVEDALGVLRGMALYDSPQRHVHVRLAEHEGRTYLDLGDSHWRAIEISAAGWGIVDSLPDGVLFRRPRSLLELPLPERGGSLDRLRDLLNIEGHADWILMVTWLLQALRDTGSYPALALAGEQGSCKSSAARLLRSLVDPSSAPLRRPPRNEHDLVIAASNGWVVALDNLSHIPDWLSDALCCLATGGGYSTRELYSDDEETIFAARRPCILTSIEDVTTRGDLLDRAVPLTLPPLRATGSQQRRRRAEREYQEAVEAARPGILGALLDAACAARQQLPHVRIESLPRMADYAELGVAAEQALGWDAGSFLAAYQGSRGQAHQVSLDSSLIYPALSSLLDSRTFFRGTCTELLQLLSSRASDATKRHPQWPSRPHGLSGHLRRLAPDLAAVGIDILFPGRSAKVRTLHIRRQEPGCKTASQASSASSDGAAHSHHGTCADDADDAPDSASVTGSVTNDAHDARDAHDDAPCDAHDPPDFLVNDADDADDAVLRPRSWEAQQSAGSEWEISG
jgi:hypothetical protein